MQTEQHIVHCLLLVWLPHSRQPQLNPSQFFEAVEQHNVEQLKQLLSNNPNAWDVKDKVKLFFITAMKDIIYFYYSMSLHCCIVQLPITVLTV